MAAYDATRRAEEIDDADRRVAMTGAVTCDPHLFVVLGATGDLAARKLLPALYQVMTDHAAADRSILVGAALPDLSDAEFRALAATSLESAGLTGTRVDAWMERTFYQRTGDDPADYARLAERIAAIETDLGLPGNRVLYLALPPAAFEGVIEQLGAAGLNTSPGWTRLVIEKPFGEDLTSACRLNAAVHATFDEAQVYRIDHYLGKETVQNLLTFRFANPIFESTWTRDRLEAIEITVAEDLGIGARAAYYERAGALRDVVQNHLTQLMTLVAMEAPSSFTADAIRNEKVQVLESIHSINPASVVYGQYTSGTVGGRAVPGYRQEEGVAPDSATATFVGAKLFVSNWRWAGVPFFLRTGKRLPRRTTQIAVTYKPAPVCIFHGVVDDCPISPNVIVLTLQPDEGFAVRFEVKSPGEPPGVVSKFLEFDYEAEFRATPDAYQTLLLDVVMGDQTLFVRADEVEASWRLWSPILERDDHPVHPYPAGTWGPAATNRGLALWTDEWTMR
jgi:glucose-6-phosphate 1-dehydrogenase